MHGLNLNGKPVVITGGASGVGKAIAKCFSANGAQVCVLDIDAKAAKVTADEITLADGDALSFACDVTALGSVSGVFSTIAAQGAIDVHVNSAGLAHVGTIGTTSTADFDRFFGVNVRGPYLCMQAAVSTMVGQLSCTILNLASIAATIVIPDRFAYSTSKGPCFQ